MNSNIFNNSKSKQDILYMLPKMERHIEYVLKVVLKLPITEKFNIGQDMKCVVYDTLKNILYLSKIDIKYRLDVANIYLNELDRYVKDELYVKWYYRYMDDVVVIVENKEKLNIYIEDIYYFSV